MKYLLAYSVAAIAGLVFVPRANAIPLFAHKYHTTCFTCHTTPPLLNDFGRRFQANGYQLPGTNEKVSLWDQPSFAFGAVAQPMLLRQTQWDNLQNTSLLNSLTFSGIEVGLFSSASLGSHFSYFTAVPIAISGGSTSIDVETANLIYSDALNDGTGSLNFRLGKFRFLVPFMENVMLSNPNTGPLVYGYDPFAGKSNLAPANTLIFSDPTFGVSAFGIIPDISNGLRWEAGMTGGNNSDIDLTTAKAYFFALDQTVYLDQAPLRFGGFYYGGTQSIADTGGIAPWTNHNTRAGVSLELYDPWTRRLDFFGQYMTGTDDNVDTVGTGYRMTGGFGGVNVIVLPEKLYVYGRYDFLTVKETNEQQNQVDLGLQYHLLPNVFVTAVYTITKDKIPETADVTTTSAGLGLRFGF